MNKMNFGQVQQQQNQPQQGYGQTTQPNQPQQQQQQKDEVKFYTGHFIGVQPRDSGTSPKGKQWSSYDVMFHHGDMTKPIRFTMFDNVVDETGQALIAGQIYTVCYVMKGFTTKQGLPGKSKKAIKVKLHQGQPLGYAQPLQSQQQQPQQGYGQTTQPQMQQPVFDEGGFLAQYRQSVPGPSQNLEHFAGCYLSNHPQSQPLWDRIKSLFQS